MQFEYQQLANNLSEVSLTGVTNETNEIEIAATGSSYPSVVDSSQKLSTQVQVAANVEMTEEVPLMSQRSVTPSPYQVMLRP